MTILGKWQKSYIKIINSLEIRQKKKKTISLKINIQCDIFLNNIELLCATF